MRIGELGNSKQWLSFHIDIDECAANNGECEHNCVNDIGNFSCNCDLGYELDNNGQACNSKDINVLLDWHSWNRASSIS